MKSLHKKAGQEMKSLCAELRPEDGLTPLELKKQQQRQQLKDHPPSQARARQYCKAVHRALESGLSSAIGDERLKDVMIESVQPLHSGGSNLLVPVISPGMSPAEMPAMEQALQKASGLLRSVIATEIQRKRTPHLTFRVIPET